MTTAPIDRAFPVPQLGNVRDLILEVFRTGLRERTNPETKVPFTESEIQAATADFGRFWANANAIDLVSMVASQRGLFLIDQLWPLTSSTWWLDNFWGPSLGLKRLPATSGGGSIAWTATPGTVFVGSTTRPDPSAATFTLGAVRYQVLYTEVTPATGTAQLFVRALETGPGTNAKAGATGAKGANYPPGAVPEGITIVEDFAGGDDAETDARYSKRIWDELQFKQAAGNPPQIRSWGRQASGQIEDCGVYSCAMDTGTCRVGVIGRRSTGQLGPLARIAPADVVDAARAYLVSPGSPVVPVPPLIVVTACASVPTDVLVRLGLPKKSAVGWTDILPWPSNTTDVTSVLTVTDPTHFRIRANGSAALAVGAVPSLMVWNKATSRFVKLAVLSVTFVAGTDYDVVLTQAPNFTVAVGDRICPDTALRDAIGLGVEKYFDSLGPGELLASTHSLFYKAERFPWSDEDLPTQLNSLILTYIREAVGVSIVGETLVTTPVTPAVPADPALPPNLLTVDDFAVYPQ